LILALTEPQVYDPHSIIQERPGPITKDSLAAESVRTGGAFSRNPDSKPLDVEGPKSTPFEVKDIAAWSLSEDKFAQSGDRHASRKSKVESVVLPVENI